MSNFSLSYCSKVDKLTPFSSKEAALAWLDTQGLDVSNTPILLPFYHENGNVELLKSHNEDDSLRVIGAGNPERKANFFSRLYRSSISKIWRINLIPHINDIDGDIPIEKNGFIIVYQKDKTAPPSKQSIGNKFAELYENERKDLLEQIKLTDTNDKPKINESRFTENLSKLGIELNIVAGICYFIYKEEDGTESVYRYIFKEGVFNRQIGDYLKKEKEFAQEDGEKIARPVQIQNNKTIRTHRIALIKEMIIKISFGVLATAIMMGTAAAAFTFLPLTAAFAVTGIAGFMLWKGIPSIYNKVVTKNQPTVEFGDKFETTLLSKYFSLSKGNFLSRIFSKLFSLFSFAKKNTPIVHVGMDQPEIEETPALTTPQSNVEVNTPANDNTNPALADVAHTESTATPLTQPSSAETNTPANDTNPAVNDAARYTNGVLTRSIFASGILTRGPFAHGAFVRSAFAPFYYNTFATTLLSKYFTLGKESLLSRIFYNPFSFAGKNTPALVAGTESTPTPLTQQSSAEANTPVSNDTNPAVADVERYASSTFAPLYNAAESIVSNATAPLYAATGFFSKGVTAATSYFFSKPANQPGTENTAVSDNRLANERSLPTPSVSR